MKISGICSQNRSKLKEMFIFAYNKSKTIFLLLYVNQQKVIMYDNNNKALQVIITIMNVLTHGSKMVQRLIYDWIREWMDESSDDPPHPE